jgi:GntR family transcriptional repressor for pyruvate dehydrogenase complex
MAENVDSSFNVADKISTVHRKNTYEIIIEQVKDLILSGDLKPGQKLPGERILAKKFGASRNSLRLALKVLEFMHLVEIRHGIGVFVSSKDVVNHAILNLNWLDQSRQHPLMDLIEARKCFEPFMTALCAKNASESDIREMENDLDSMEKSLRRKQHGVEQASVFHKLILDSAQNFVLRQIGLMLQSLMDESKKVSLSRLEYTSQSLLEHREILEAIQNRDPAEASAKMLKHLESVQKHLEKSGI